MATTDSRQWHLEQAAKYEYYIKKWAIKAFHLTKTQLLLTAVILFLAAAYLSRLNYGTGTVAAVVIAPIAFLILWKLAYFLWQKVFYIIMRWHDAERYVVDLEDKLDRKPEGLKREMTSVANCRGPFPIYRINREESTTVILSLPVHLYKPGGIEHNEKALRLVIDLIAQVGEIAIAKGPEGLDEFLRNAPWSAKTV